MTKILIVSDIHGSTSSSEKILELDKVHDFKKIFILGDVNYSGARNVPPFDYYPINVVNNLNLINDKIVFICGNCDSRVDSFVFKKEFFNIYKENINGFNFIFTHGDLFNETNLELKDKDVLLMGHTHIYEAKKVENHYIFNDGSITLPKNNNPKTYMIFDTSTNIMSLFDIDDNEILTLELV